MNQLMRKELGELGVVLAAGVAVGAMVVGAGAGSGPGGNLLIACYAVAVLGAALGSQQYASEIEGGTYELLLSRPVSRLGVWRAKWTAGALSALSAAAVFLAVLSLGGRQAAFGALGGLEASGILFATALMGYAAGLFLSTQLSKRLDSCFAAVFLAMALVTIVNRSELWPALLSAGLAAAASLASLAAVEHGDMMRSWRRNAAGVAAAGAALVVMAGGVAGLHLLQTRAWAPEPTAILDAVPGGDGTLLVTTRVRTGAANLFRREDTRVAQVEARSGRTRWLPLRWAKVSSRRSASRVIVDGPWAVAGYPIDMAIPAEYDLATGKLSSRLPFSEIPGTSGYPAYRLTQTGRGVAGCEIRRVTGPKDRGEVFFSTPELAVQEVWALEPGLLVLARDSAHDYRLRALVLDDAGGRRADEWVPGITSPSVRVSLMRSSVRSGASVAGAPASPRLVCWLSLWDDFTRRETILRMEVSGQRATFRELAREVLPGSLHSECGPDFLLSVLEPGPGDSWSGALLRFSDSGEELSRLELGPRARIGELDVTEDGSRALARVERGAELGAAYLLIDPRGMTATPVLTGQRVPNRPTHTFGFIDSRRWFYVLDHSIRVVDDTRAGLRTDHEVFAIR